ncbi:hypothetical protein KIN20_004326 [Parelaphostrongylus tenuis]|uniref:Uncharacterized protein n=1 Tax=Parelaphostrongylus tenuis TaxID=148309 RepID=A0AAD5LYA3_PARTN|nr:hypothetical protein KIN20_004326 [Parelaphostrongylus tenuis]
MGFRWMMRIENAIIWPRQQRKSVCEGGRDVKNSAETAADKVKQAGRNAYDAVADKVNDAKDYVGDKMKSGGDHMKK